MQKNHSLIEAQKKLEHYCAYQERCHEEVIKKSRALFLSPSEIDEVVVHLIQNNFLNEERFACSFARGKHRIKHWGKIRIVNELKFRNISTYIINKALKEITQEDYLQSFNCIADRFWESLTESNPLKKRKKYCDYLLRKGFESNLIYEKVKDLEST